MVLELHYCKTGETFKAPGYRHVNVEDIMRARLAAETDEKVVITSTDGMLSKDNSLTIPQFLSRYLLSSDFCRLVDKKVYLYTMCNDGSRQFNANPFDNNPLVAGLGELSIEEFVKDMKETHIESPESFLDSPTMNMVVRDKDLLKEYFDWATAQEVNEGFACVRHSRAIELESQGLVALLKGQYLPLALDSVVLGGRTLTGYEGLRGKEYLFINVNSINR